MAHVGDKGRPSPGGRPPDPVKEARREIAALKKEIRAMGRPLPSSTFKTLRNQSNFICEPVADPVGRLLRLAEETLTGNQPVAARLQAADRYLNAVRAALSGCVAPDVSAIASEAARGMDRIEGKPPPAPPVRSPTVAWESAPATTPLSLAHLRSSTEGAIPAREAKRLHKAYMREREATPEVKIAPNLLFTYGGDVYFLSETRGVLRVSWSWLDPPKDDITREVALPFAKVANILIGRDDFPLWLDPQVDHSQRFVAPAS